jgi:hypothetical protein
MRSTISDAATFRRSFHEVPSLPDPDKPEPNRRNKKRLAQSRKGRKGNLYVLVLLTEKFWPFFASLAAQRGPHDRPLRENFIPFLEEFD